MQLKIIGITEIILVSVLVLGCVESQSNQSTSIESAKSEIIITAVPVQMLPTINEMPDSSKKLGETANETFAERKFRLDDVFPNVLIYRVNKFSSIDEAINNYSSIKGKYSEYKLSSVNLGNDAFGLEEASSGATVIYRKANVIVQVHLLSNNYDSSLSDAIDFAGKVRI